MSRLSFRPRPLDVNKKLRLLKTPEDFEEDDEGPTRNAHHGIADVTEHVSRHLFTCNKESTAVWLKILAREGHFMSLHRAPVMYHLHQDHPVLVLS